MSRIVTKKFFKRLNIITIIAVYLLILVGGIVRSTGSGMGCPDWPKCFGSYVPPTSEDQLPPDYKEIYLAKRVAKNERVAKMIAALGFERLADQIQNDPNIFVEQDFNVTETWIEYLNRLLGVVIGLLIFAVLVTAFILRKQSKSILFYALLAFVLVAFQGWLGSIVVSTNLLPGMITAHMILAMILVCVLIYLAFKLEDDQTIESNYSDWGKLSQWLIVALVLFLIQIALGTQVREAIDKVALTISNRSEWIESMGISFYIHRTYSLLILMLHVFLAYKLFKVGETGRMRLLTYSLVGLIGLEILTGAVLSYFAVPAVLQPVHLMLATLIFGIQFYALLVTRKIKTIQTVNV
ncbi:MAG: COX15/CtaA family protein [bacterium]|nr:COX15/CtaA family protein [bacterium]